MAFPTKPSDGSSPVYVYNCDGTGNKGLIPATINTIGATECTCEIAGQSVQNGVCRCPAETGLRLNGTCGACPSGQSIQVDGICGACAIGQTIIDGKCTCLGGQVVIGGVCACPVGQVIKSGVCAAPTTPGEKCTAAKWHYDSSVDSCFLDFKISGGSRQQACGFDSALPFLNHTPCEDVFGADYSFPFNPNPYDKTGSDLPVYVYNCDPNDESGLIPATINTIGATECTCPAGQVILNGACVACTGGQEVQDGVCACTTFGQELNGDGVCACASGSVVHGGACIPEEGDFGEALSDELLCGAFGGTVQAATGGDEVCSGMDANDTFCIMDSAAGFPCRGLFKHLRSCNVEFNRKALNPFFCGENCGAQKAVGSECR